jgi:hypothetical protein
LNSGEDRRTSAAYVILSFALVAVVFVGSHLLDIPGSLAELLRATNGVPILDLSPAFSVEETYARIEAYGEEGRRLYRRFAVTTDILFPAVLLSFLILLARFAVDRMRIPTALRWIVLALPFGYVIPDLVENFTIFWLLSDFPERHGLLARLLPYFTLAKRLSLYGSMLLPLALLALKFKFGWWTSAA